MEYSQAIQIANKLLADFQPHCEKINVAGSLRQGIPWVKDIEIVAQPTQSLDMFGQPTDGPGALDAYLETAASRGQLGQRLKNGPRYKQFALPQGINLDLFIVRPPAQWGVILAIRTGPAYFSKWLVTGRPLRGALPRDCHIKQGAVHYQDTIIATPTEKDFFDLLGLEWIHPTNRHTIPNLYRPLCPGHMEQTFDVSGT